jgi:hypothetical protein
MFSLNINLSDDLWAKIDKYRFKEMFATRTEAIVHLLTYAWSKTPNASRIASNRRTDDKGAGFDMAYIRRTQQAINQVVYEYANLVSAGELLKVDHAPPINTHMQDAFLMSARKIADFFTRQPYPTDLATTDYGIPFKARADLKVWDEWHRAINVQLAHLSMDRVTAPKSFDGAIVNGPLLDELRAEWKRFLSDLLRISPDVHALFEAAIVERLTGDGFQNLDLR